MKQPDKLFGRAIERAQVSCLGCVGTLSQRFYSIKQQLETELEKQLTKLCFFVLRPAWRPACECYTQLTSAQACEAKLLKAL